MFFRNIEIFNINLKKIWGYPIFVEISIFFYNNLKKICGYPKKYYYYFYKSYKNLGVPPNIFRNIKMFDIKLTKKGGTPKISFFFWQKYEHNLGVPQSIFRTDFINALHFTMVGRVVGLREEEGEEEGERIKAVRNRVYPRAPADDLK